MSESTLSSRDVIEHFWQTMQSNDFRAAAQWLHDDYVLDWPQSGERIRGRDNFAIINERYPAAGRWQFTINRLVAEGDQAVSDVTVTDGQITGRAITFSTVHDGKIVRQVEYWPDPFEAPAWRAQWVESMGQTS